MMRSVMVMTTAAACLCLATMAFAHDTGPHKGPAAEWGEEEYHVEVVADKAGSVTVYIYGDHSQFDKGILKPIPKNTKVTLTLKTEPATVIKLEASPEKSDPEGTSSKFTAKHEVFKKDQKWKGSVSAKIGNKPYSGDFGK